MLRYKMKQLMTTICTVLVLVIDVIMLIATSLAFYSRLPFYQLNQIIIVLDGCYHEMILGPF